jgi:hypothetical protein
MKPDGVQFDILNVGVACARRADWLLNVTDN